MGQIEKAKSKNVQQPNEKYQYLAALVVSLQSISFGIACGWSSPNIPLLQSDQTPLGSAITLEEGSWVASLLTIGALIGNVFFGYITSIFGRKEPLIYIAFPTIVSWALIWFAPNVYYLYGARMLNGFVGGGVYVIFPLFFAEIANDRIRGALSSTLTLSNNFGILLGFVFGNYFDFYTIPKISIALTIISVIALFFFPESPSFLMKQNRVSDAENSIRFYQNMRGTTTEYDMFKLEMDKLKNALRDVSIDKCNKNSFKWSDLIETPEYRKAMIIGIFIAMLNQCSGCFAMLNYTAIIFKEAGSSMSPNICAIIVGLIQFVGSYVATVLVDRAGRKLLFIVSTVGTALSLITLAVFLMLKTWNYSVDAFNWVPIASFSSLIFLANLGLMSLPFLIISEVMPEKLKDFGSSFCLALVWICSFVMVKFLPFLSIALGLHGTMFLFAAVCLSGALFFVLVVPETKGRSQEEIMNLLR